MESGGGVLEAEMRRRNFDRENLNSSLKGVDVIDIMENFILLFMSDGDGGSYE